MIKYKYELSNEPTSYPYIAGQGRLVLYIFYPNAGSPGVFEIIYCIKGDYYERILL